MKVIILGAGLSGLSLAYFLRDFPQVSQITLLEKEDRPGGLCRSVRKDSYIYDIGPHIIFSKDEETLGWLRKMIEGNENKLRRSNQILYNGRYIQYPFENDLSKLPDEELDYCIRTFKDNPYETYMPSNMLQFFLKTFGEGITNVYLRPYNEKIWKFDPGYMNTQMVERIPKPTDEEIKRSASGETIDGYLHQLYFSYPSAGGIEAVIQAVISRLGPKCQIITNYEVNGVEKSGSGYFVKSNGGHSSVVSGNVLVSTIPVQELYQAYCKKEDAVGKSVRELKFNSIKIFFVKTREDLCGDNFTFTVPDKNVIFHRISKMDFLGDAYRHGGASYMVEVTYREGGRISGMPDERLAAGIIAGIVKIGFAKTEDDVEILDVTDQKYAYVIYDLCHTKNMEKIRKFFDEEGIFLTGRFGNFEYWNMDRIVQESKKLSEKIEHKIK